MSWSLCHVYCCRVGAVVVLGEAVLSDVVVLF
jgi:hypothetical protein